MSFVALLTTVGQTKIAAATAAGSSVILTDFAVGDANGTPYDPAITQTVLENEVFRDAINNRTLDPNDTLQVKFECIVPESEGGWYIRELGLFDADGDLIIICNYPETFKPGLGSGVMLKQFIINVIVKIDNPDLVTININPGALATISYVDDKKTDYTSSAVLNLTDEDSFLTAKSLNYLPLVRPWKTGITYKKNDLVISPISGNIIKCIATTTDPTDTSPQMGADWRSHGAGENVMDYGAVGDGVTDDTDAWNAFISADGLKLINPGSYLVNGIVKNYASGVYLHENVNDYAFISTNLLPAFASLPKVNFDSAGNHTAGTVGTMTASVAGNPFGYYQLKIVVNTTSTGAIAINQSGDTIFGEIPSYTFSTAAVLNDALENNPYVTSNEYYFFISTTSAGFSNINIATDTSWAGSVTAIELYEVTPTEFSFAGVGSTANGVENPVGIKVGAFNRNDTAIGNRYTLGMKTWDTAAPSAQNIAMGSYALATNFKGDENTAIGTLALAYNEGSNNVGIGYSALRLNTKGQENTAVGYKAGLLNTTGYRNTFVGFWSGAYSQTGINNTRVGWQPNIAGGICNSDTSMGAPAGTAVLNGAANCFFGAGAGTVVSGLSTLTLTGAVGVGAGSKPWGDYSICLGFNAKVGTESVFAAQSISIGYNATTVESTCVTIGDSINNTAAQSVAIGHSVVSTGQQGTVLGFLAEGNGYRNTALGSQSGVGFSGQSNTFVGATAGIQTVAYENCTLLGSNTAVTGSNQVQLGDSATTTYAYGAVQNRSDVRDKADIRDTKLGLDFITALRPVDFKWDYRESYRDIDIHGNIIEHSKDGSKKQNRFHHGLIAQELKTVLDDLGVDFGGYQDHSIKGGQDILSIGYEELIAPMIKAIQELKAEIDALKAAK